MASPNTPQRARRLIAGETVALNNLSGKPIRRLLFGATWDDPKLDIDMCAVMLEVTGKVPDRSYFLYRRNRQLPSHAGFLGYVPPEGSSGPDRAQVMLDLDRLPARIVRIDVGFSAVQRGTTLAQTGNIKARVMDLDNGQTSYVYIQSSADLGNATCLSLWSLRCSNDHKWSAAVLGTPYPGGPPYFARDHGVTFS